MKARISKPSERKLLLYKAPEHHAVSVAAAARAFGAEMISTEDCETPICTLLGEGEIPPTETADKPDDECLLISGFDRQTLSELVDMLRDSGVRIPLKAMYTPHNRSWNFSQLIRELRKEHEYMNGGTKR